MYVCFVYAVYVYAFTHRSRSFINKSSDAAAIEKQQKINWIETVNWRVSQARPQPVHVCKYM